MDDTILYQRLMQKAFSIRGIRKLNYLFKLRRREAISAILK
jgi:hypothetical protein